MSRLAAFFSAIWLATTTAHPRFLNITSDVATSIQHAATSELQVGLAPVGENVVTYGFGLCKGVKKIVGVSYDNYKDKEPDMSHLNLVFITGANTVIYNLAKAPMDLPLEPWFDPEQPLLIFFHGFTDNPQKNSFQTMRTAVQEALGDVNILALDASSLIAFFYLKSSTMVRLIGEHVGATLAALHQKAGLNCSKIHLIGHSLGSHIAGFAGKEFLKRTGQKVGRISSLDPAGPCFGDLEPEKRLCEDDAEFVDVIHSDAGVYGLSEKVGDVDFWLNGGSNQPNCFFHTCSHSRSWEAFADSFKYPNGFQAVACDSYYDFRNHQCNLHDTSIMGYFTPTTTRGNYYLMTAGESPFGVGELGLTYTADGIFRSISDSIKDFMHG